MKFIKLIAAVKKNRTECGFPVNFIVVPCSNASMTPEVFPLKYTVYPFKV